MSYRHLLNVDTQFLIEYHMITFMNVTTDLFQKLFRYWETVKVMVTCIDATFPKFWFSLESSNLIIDNKCCQLFSAAWSDSLTWFIFGKMSARYPSVNNCSLLVILSSKKQKKKCFVKKMTSLVCSSSTCSFPRDSLYTSIYRTRAEGVIPTLSHMIIKKMCTQ